MIFNSKLKRSAYVLLSILLLVFLLFYMRERKFTVNSDTEITIAFNGEDIALSADRVKAFKEILSSLRIHRTLSRLAGPYHNESTIFIRVHDNNEKGKIRGDLTICLDNLSRTNFAGSEPNGWFRVKRRDLERIVEFLSPIIEPHR